MSTATTSHSSDLEQSSEARRKASSCSTSTLIGTPRSPSKAHLPAWRDYAPQDTENTPSYDVNTSNQKDDDNDDVEKQCEEQTEEHHKPLGHPIEHIYPNHHGFAIFLFITILLTLAHVATALAFRIACYTPTTEAASATSSSTPQTHNGCTANMSKWTRAFVNKQPWQFCFAIIWMVIIWGFQWIWDRDNMRSGGWRYRLGALVPLLFNASLGTFFFSGIGYILLSESVRPIVATAAGEQASGF